VSQIGQLRTFSWRWLLPLVIAAAGCDLTGQYEKKFQEALKTSAQQAVFDQNLHATFTDVIDTARQPIGVKLRLPQIFDASSKADFRDTSKAMAQAGVALPAGVAAGSIYTLSRVIDGPDGQKLPCSVGLMATPKSPDSKPEMMQNAIAKTMSAVFPGATWTDVSVQSPSGQPITLKRMRMEQSLPGAKGAKTEIRQDQYFVDAGNHMVIITWSTPKAAPPDLEKAIEASMGTIEIAGQPPAGNPPAGNPPAGKAASGCF
jgi:hypothetical protein